MQAQKYARLLRDYRGEVLEARRSHIQLKLFLLNIITKRSNKAIEL